MTGEVYGKLEYLNIFPATQYVTSKPTIERAHDEIKLELEQQVKKFESEGRMLEAHRIRQRTEYDLEMMKELGFCNGIENYSRILDGRPAGSAPYTLIDYFPSDFIVFLDESHQSVPQIGGMYEGDRSRKQTLVDFGFRLPSALDNRPLRFDEFLAKVPQIVFVSATPGRTSCATRRGSPSSSSARPGSSTRRSSCARRRTRSTTCSTRSGGARSSASARSSRR